MQSQEYSSAEEKADNAQDILNQMGDMHSHYDIVPWEGGFAVLRSYEISDDMLREYGSATPHLLLGSAGTLEQLHEAIIDGSAFYGDRLPVSNERVRQEERRVEQGRRDGSAIDAYKQHIRETGIIPTRQGWKHFHREYRRASFYDEFVQESERPKDEKFWDQYYKDQDRYLSDAHKGAGQDRFTHRNAYGYTDADLVELNALFKQEMDRHGIGHWPPHEQKEFEDKVAADVQHLFRVKIDPNDLVPERAAAAPAQHQEQAATFWQRMVNAGRQIREAVKSAIQSERPEQQHRSPRIRR